MNKKFRYTVFFIFIVLAGSIAFAPRFAAAQESPTTTPTSTFTSTTTSTPSSTPTLTPTIAPSETLKPTVVPVETHTPMPTPYSVSDIHSEFEKDFENINVQLTAIYDQVYSPPGSSIIEGLAVEFLADAIKPSEQANNTINFWAKLIGSISLFFKVTIVIVRVVKKDQTKWEFFNRVLGVFIFVYAFIFVLLLFKPNILEQQYPPVISREVSLNKIEDQLSSISTYLESHTISPSVGVQTDSGGNVQMTDVENQLANVAKELSEIKLQDQQSVEEIGGKLDEVNANIKDVKTASAKRGWLGFNTLLLLVILGLLIYSRIEGR